MIEDIFIEERREGDGKFVCQVEGTQESSMDPCKWIIGRRIDRFEGYNYFVK